MILRSRSRPCFVSPSPSDLPAPRRRRHRLRRPSGRPRRRAARPSPCDSPPRPASPTSPDTWPGTAPRSPRCSRRTAIRAGYEIRPDDVKGARDRRCSSSVQEASSTSWLERRRSTAPGADAPTLTLIDHVATTVEGGHDDHEVEVDPHWWQDPRNAIARRRGDPGRAGRGRPGDGRADVRRATPPPTRRGCAELDRAVAACIDAHPAGAAQARHEVTTRSPTTPAATASR